MKIILNCTKCVGTIGEETAVTALQPLLLLSDPDRVRPGWVEVIWIKPSVLPWIDP